jgi:hypothetical protein
MIYIATNEGAIGISEDITEAFNELKDEVGNFLSVQECTFYEAKEIKVVQEIKQVPISTIKKAK